jgi:hypothetical protein
MAGGVGIYVVFDVFTRGGLIAVHRTVRAGVIRRKAPRILPEQPPTPPCRSLPKSASATISLKKTERSQRRDVELAARWNLVSARCDGLRVDAHPLPSLFSNMDRPIRCFIFLFFLFFLVSAFGFLKFFGFFASMVFLSVFLEFFSFFLFHFSLKKYWTVLFLNKF